jgi:hypothetical protein
MHQETLIQKLTEKNQQGSVHPKKDILKSINEPPTHLAPLLLEAGLVLEEPSALLHTAQAEIARLPRLCP